MENMSLEKRILGTNDWGLLGILNEALIDGMKESKIAIDEENYSKLNDLNNLIRDILAELIILFRNENEASRNLRELYLFVNKLITKGENNKDKTFFHQGIQIIEPILGSFKERAVEEEGKIVSGLTYGESDLMESKTESSRTFQV